MEHETKRIALIIPYYGRLPEYFSIWLKSAEFNSEIDFILITDLITQEKCPRNVKVWNWTFEEIRTFFQQKFDFPISLKRPYKLCDYKAAYGYIFEDYLREYDFWGCCDMDCVMGDLCKCLNPILQHYDVIGKYGHLSLYRNAQEINRVFMESGAVYSYKEVFSNEEIYAFDEVSGVKRIFANSKWKCFFELEGMADIRIAHKAFRLAHGMRNYKEQIFIWENGKVYQVYEDNDSICYKEFAYLHFQKKCPIPCSRITDSFYVLYDCFINRVDKSTDVEMLKKTARYHNPVILEIEKEIWVLKRLVKLIRMGKKQRSINNYKRRFVNLY